MSNQTTVSISRDQKPTIEQAQEALADELGFEPSQGQTVVHLCRNYVEDR